jgi:hypothetical protein
MRAMRKRLPQSRWSRLIPLAGALALLTTSAFAQMPTPSMSLQGDKKRPLTPEEQERQKQLDNDYKAATSKIPDQTANDPWAAIRPAPSTPSPKTPTIAGAKKKQQ